MAKGVANAWREDGRGGERMNLQFPSGISQLNASLAKMKMADLGPAVISPEIQNQGSLRQSSTRRHGGSDLHSEYAMTG